MKRQIIPFLFLLLCTACTQKDSLVRLIGTTPAEDTCYAKGVSGAYCGYVDGHILLAGGANFPDYPAANGGVKRYYDAIYATRTKVSEQLLQRGGKNGLSWQQVGVLPTPMAYGVTVSNDDGMVIIGGCNTGGGLTLAIRIKHRNGTLQLEQLPALPYSLDNMAGALLGNRIYVVGGLKDGEPSAAMFALDFNYGEWFECAPLPNPRLQPVCVAQKGKLYVWGGYVQPVDSLGRVQADGCTVYSDGYCYDPQTNEWTPLPAPSNADGHPVTLSGGAAVAWGDDEILALGGVNRNVFLGGIQGIFPMPDYLLHEPEWYRFNSSVLVYSTKKGEWRALTQSSLTARAGAMLVTAPASDGNAALLLGGELKPGIRTNEVTLITEKNGYALRSVSE